MNLIWFVAFLLLGAWSFSAHARVELLSDQEPQQVFGGGARTIILTWHNSGQKHFSQELSARLYQASSTTIVPLGTVPWSTLEILPGQTMIESISLIFPAVNAESRFVIQWFAGTNQVLGSIEALVYPTSLLKELKPLAGDEPLGILDPQNLLKPLLKAAAIEFLDLEDANIGNYSGRLLIAGPFQSKAQMREGLAFQVRAVAKKGTGVVWLLPPPERKERRRENLRPSFYTVSEGKGTVVVVQASLTASLSESPQAQLNLIQFARLALHPKPVHLPP